MGSGEQFNLNLTLLCRLKEDHRRENEKYAHKKIKIPFAPFKDLRIEHEEGEWEVIINNIFELTYQLGESSGTFTYTDIHEFNSEAERQDFMSNFLEYGWAEGHGYKK